MTKKKYMYRVERYRDVIDKIEVISSTPKTVTFVDKHRNRGQTRENRTSNYLEWFDTYEGAETYLRERLVKKLGQAKATIIVCEQVLATLDRRSSGN